MAQMLLESLPKTVTSGEKFGIHVLAFCNLVSRFNRLRRAVFGFCFLPNVLSYLLGNASVKLSALLHLFLELIVFGLPIVALFAAGKPHLAWIYGTAVIINRFFMFVWGQ